MIKLFKTKTQKQTAVKRHTNIVFLKKTFTSKNDENVFFLFIYLIFIYIFYKIKNIMKQKKANKSV